ncbi:hypothetical protein ACLB1T_18400 [Escherichia coli]
MPETSAVACLNASVTLYCHSRFNSELSVFPKPREVAMSTGLRFTLEVDGLPPDAFAVVSFHLNQSLSSLFSLDLSLVSQQFLSLEFQQILDKMAYLTIWQGDDVQRRVKGVVTWFELGRTTKTRCCTA